MSRLATRMPYLHVIRSPRYFPLWRGQIISNLGDTLNDVALAGASLYLAGHVLQTAMLPWLTGLLHALAPHARAVHPVTARHG
jgi:hypothetical protein